jgi:plasmid stability protein
VAPDAYAKFARFTGSQHPGKLAKVKVTIELPDQLYRAVKVEAARADRSVRDIVNEALEAWLTTTEDAEDRRSAAEALAEYRRDGGTSADAFFGTLAAETKASYGSSEE